MGENGAQAVIAEVAEAVAELRGNAVVAEFDEQVVGVADHVVLRAVEDALEVFVGKMKVAAQAELGRGANFGAQLFDHA